MTQQSQAGTCLQTLPKLGSKAGPTQTTTYMRILQSTRLQPNSLQQCVLPAQLPALLEIWTSASPYPVISIPCSCPYTQEGLEELKNVTTMPSIVNHPGKGSGVILVQTASHPLFTRITSLHSIKDPVHVTLALVALQSPPLQWKN